MKQRTKIGLGIAAAVLVASLPLMAIAGWYPNRELKKWEGDNTVGYDHVQFNSFYNTPTYGNETEFFDGKQSNVTPFTDDIKVKVGQELTLRTYVHNGADPSLNGPNFTGPGVAKNTTVKIGLPQGFGTKMNGVSQISASNAKPGSVFDTVNFTSADGTPFTVKYIPGSAYASTHSVPRMPLSDNIVTTGALIGENSPNGDVPGCFAYADFVDIHVKVEAAPLQIQKTVAFPSQPFVEQVNAKPGERLYFKVDFKNAGTTQMNGVAISDRLPSQFELLPGTVKLYNQSHPEGYVLSDTAIFTAGGQGVGDYLGGANGYILYQVKLKDTATSLLTNVACVRSTDVPYDTCDDAKVVPPTPPTPPTPVTPIPPTPVPNTPSSSLPNTGMESSLLAAVGMTGMAGSIRAYRKSKKDVTNALKGKK